MQNKKQYFLIFFSISVIIILESLNYLFDQILGDGEGIIYSYGITKIITCTQIIFFIIIIYFLIKIYKKFFFYIIAIVLVFDLFLFPIIFKKMYPFFHSDSEKNVRYPMPYVGFTGKPNWGKHNKYGFLGKDISQAKQDDFIIAFFGGSTGYIGDPPLPEMIELNLKEKKFNDGKVFLSNFSVVSSNHNQHLHMLVEYLLNKKVDLIIFYGGYNETLSTASYDPRPGYPYNFFYIHDTPLWKKLYIENSIIIPTVLKKFGKHSLLLDKSKLNQKVYSNNWNLNIFTNYFFTLKRAKFISDLISSKTSRNVTFMAFYQPYQVSNAFNDTHELIRASIDSIDYIYDMSSVYDELKDPFTDPVHVIQEAKKHMALSISKLIIDEFSSKIGGESKLDNIMPD